MWKARRIYYFLQIYEPLLMQNEIQQVSIDQANHRIIKDEVLLVPRNFSRAER
jgi:hypothetical protein